MTRKNRITLGSGLPAAGLLTIALLATGCVVEKKGANGDEDVKIATPLGGMQVKTNNAVVAANIGLPVYPGAVEEKKKSGDDDNAADVNMSFGNFHLRVNAMSYLSTDPPAKVQAFYQKALAQYGDVIECRGKTAVGQPTRTSQGLTCDDDSKGKHIVTSSSSVDSELQLKAGSRQHQHIVGIDPNGAGTKFGLVELEMPSGDWSNDKQTN